MLIAVSIKNIRIVKMPRFVIPAFIATIIFAALAYAESLPNQAVILPRTIAPMVLQQCSRSTINKADSFWEPSSDQILLMEKQLVKLLNKKTGVKPIHPFHQYYRQYVGVTRNGKKLIYGNFFYMSFVQKPYVSKTFNWRKEPVVVCDGGANFWGIVYDVQDQKFEPPQYNGEA